MQLMILARAVAFYVVEYFSALSNYGQRPVTATCAELGPTVLRSSGLTDHSPKVMYAYSTIGVALLVGPLIIAVSALCAMSICVLIQVVRYSANLRIL